MPTHFRGNRGRFKTRPPKANMVLLTGVYHWEVHCRAQGEPGREDSTHLDTSIAYSKYIHFVVTSYVAYSTAYPAASRVLSPTFGVSSIIKYHFESCISFIYSVLWTLATVLYEIIDFTCFIREFYFLRLLPFS